MRITLLKLGGSLLDLPDLADRLVRLIDDRGWSCPVVVTGGGELVNGIRRLDDRWTLPDSVSHQLAIEAMSINATIVRTLHERFIDAALQDGRLVAGPRAQGTSIAQAPSAQTPSAQTPSAQTPTAQTSTAPDHADRPPLWSSRAIMVPRPDRLLHQLEQSRGLPPLPASWDITSDSVAAWMAGCLPARLVLLKSVDLPETIAAASASSTSSASTTPASLWQSLQQAGLVDRGFAQWVKSVQDVQWCNLRRDPPVCLPLTAAAPHGSSVSPQDQQQQQQQ